MALRNETAKRRARRAVASTRHSNQGKSSDFRSGCLGSAKIYLQLLIVSILLTASLSGGIALAADTKDQDVTITPVGPQQPVYRWQTDRCQDAFIPDAPARAYRRADGQIEFIATHMENWMLLGTAFNRLRPVCRSILSSAPLRAAGKGKFWIEATYTSDGRSVIALLSRDLSDETRNAGCRAEATGKCWLNEIVAARSIDMGNTFTPLLNADGVVASFGRNVEAANDGRFGVFTTTNIISRKHLFYMLAFVQGPKSQISGNCLFRTEDPYIPTSWHAWNGKDFANTLHGQSESAGDLCTPVGVGVLTQEVRSISFIAAKNIWVAVFASRRQLPGDTTAVPGFYYAESNDLIDWGKVERIVPFPLRPRSDSNTNVMMYPSLIDPLSRSPNFDTVNNASAYLFFTVYHLKNGQGSMNRDIDYLPVAIH
jgi:hypothetical protein